MLDNETKRRIDTARDILVGKVPDPKSQVEQITIAMIYKFMDDMDKEALDYGGQRSFFVGDYEKYAWTNLFDPRMGGHEVLNLYGEALVKLPLNTNPDFPQLFRDIFKNAYLPYRDPETLKLFIKTINEFSYDHSEKLGDAFEYLLSIMGSQGDAGQFRTPRNIIDFVVEILQPKKHETMLDPACGTAGFLISAFKHILKANTSLNNAKEGNLLTPDERTRLTKNIRGYDISPDMVRLSLVNLYLHGFTNPEIYEYDSLSTEDRWNEYYDVILANPPFMTPKGGIKPHKRFSIKSNRAEVLFVDFIAEHLTPTGRAGIIVPEGIIFQSGTAYKSLRKMLIDKYLWAVVSLPAGIFNPYSGVKTSILLLDKTLSKKTDNILFVKVQEDGFGLGAQRRANDKNDLPTALNLLKKYQTSIKEQQTTPFGDAVHDEMALVISKAKIIENGDYNFSGDRYKVSKLHELTEFEIVSLGDVSELEYGFTDSAKEIGDARFIRITDIDENGGLKDTGVKFIELNENSKKSLLKKGDLLVARTGATYGKTMIFEENYPSVFASYLIRIRFKNNTLLPKFYWNFAQTDFYWNQAKELVSGGGQPQFNGNALKNIKIPLPPLTIQQQIVNEIEGYQQVIDGAKQVIKAYKPHVSIKKHWEMVELGEIFKCKSGSTPSRSNNEYFENATINWVKTLDLDNGEIWETEEKISEKGLEESSCQILPKGSVLIAMYGGFNQIGRTGILKVEAATNQAITALLPNEMTIPEFTNLMLITYRDKWKNVANSTRKDPNITKQDVLNFKIPLPPLSEQEEIVSAIEKEQQLVNANRELVAIMEAKIKAKIAEVWGDEKRVKKEVIYQIADKSLAQVAEA